MKKDYIQYYPHKCPLCLDRYMNLFGQPLPNHAQIRCTLDSGDKVDIAVCKNCSVNLDNDTLNKILNGIKLFWEQEIDNNLELNNKQKTKSKNRFKKFGITKFNKPKLTGLTAEKQARKEGKLK